MPAPRFSGKIPGGFIYAGRFSWAMKTSLAAWLSPKYLDEKAIAKLRKEFDSAKPFSHLEMASFLHEKKAAALLKFVADQDFIEKRSDLFQLKQTHDFAGSSGLLKEFRDFLCSAEFTNYMKKLTGITLVVGKVDAHGSLYEDTDYLLCHDDELDSRKIAFLFYLTEMFPGQGGTLNLFVSKNGKPVKVSKKVLPQFNKFAFFAVTKKSFHEVEEMYISKGRIAIGGWLHG